VVRINRPPKPAACLKDTVLFCTRIFGSPISPMRYTIRRNGRESPRASNAPPVRGLPLSPNRSQTMTGSAVGDVGVPRP
jgi:hypothetical protein